MRVAEVPDDAMPVDHDIEDSDHENYARFPITDVIEWYTVYEDGEIKRERFISEKPSHPKDIEELLKNS